ncbi:MAG: serine protease [Thermoguttaceae bacterium]
MTKIVGVILLIVAGAMSSTLAAAPEPAAKAAPAAKPAATAGAKAAAAEQPAAVVLQEDVPAQAVLDLEARGIALFRIDVPKDAVQMTIRILNNPVMLDLLARMEKPMATAEEADHRSGGDVLDPSLRISRQSLPPLAEGTWYIGVTDLDSGPAVVHKRPVKQVPFSLKVSFVRARIDCLLQPGKKTHGRVSAEEGSVYSFAIDVPAEAKALRLDLDDVSSDLDILARRGAALVANQDADATAISPLGRESLLIDRSSPTPLAPGRWYVNVVHPSGFGVVEFSIYASFSPQPPAALLVIPKLACPADPRKRAIQAIVDVSTEIAGASGTLLTANGLVLTNYHVVAEVAEGAADKDPIVIGATIDPQDTPRELFRGRVVLFDKRLDLALIQITCGLYRQPLPAGYLFPTLPLGDPATLEIGDPISIIGFPSIGGTAGRVSVTLTQGVLSGFEKTAVGTLMKTDANISPGSSGGAALDSHWRLIGVPTFENVSPEAVSHMSYVQPLSLLPAEWRKKIKP